MNSINKASNPDLSTTKRAATKRKRAKKQGVGGKPTVVKAMKDKKKDMKGKKGMVMVIAVTAKPKKVGVKKKKD